MCSELQSRLLESNLNLFGTTEKFLLCSSNRRGAYCTHRGGTFTCQDVTVNHQGAITNTGLASGYLLELFMNLIDFQQKSITHE